MKLCAFKVTSSKIKFVLTYYTVYLLAVHKHFVTKGRKAGTPKINFYNNYNVDGVVQFWDMVMQLEHFLLQRRYILFSMMSLWILR